jgi:hypothetical protein
MKNWAYLLFAAVAVGAAVAVTLALRRKTPGEDLDEIPKIIDQCHDRIRQIEAQLHQLRPAPEPAS